MAMTCQRRLGTSSNGILNEEVLDATSCVVIFEPVVESVPGFRV